MATSASGEFEKNIERLDEIVKLLENESTTLDQAVQFFKEGKVLALRCDALLKDAQKAIAATDEVPVKPQTPASQPTAREPTDELLF